MEGRHFRNALCRYATGVTIITARAESGEPVGITANSFSSLSLEPPLVLWSLAGSALSLPSFRASEYFAVHVLGREHGDLALRFARRGADKFAELEIRDGLGGLPVIDGVAALFQCRTVRRYSEGDHDLFIGQVLHFDYWLKEPLIFFQGLFRDLAEDAASKPPLDAPAMVTTQSISKLSLGYV